MSAIKLCRGGCMIGPSILNADLSKLAEECQRMLDAGADYLHLDVMDGAPVVKSLRDKFPGVPFEVHMMVSNPEQWIGDMADAGADIYTFHLEASSQPEKTVKLIRDGGMMAGCGIKPKTSVDELSSLAPLLDVLLVMTVEPGFGGQSFMEDMMPKVEKLRKDHPDANIEVDGGLSPKTIEIAARAGANFIVSGSAVVKSSSPGKVIAELKDVVNRYRNK